MDLPKFHETFIPILETLKNREAVHRSDLSSKVLSGYYADLPEELLSQKLKSGDSLILNRIGWGKSYLKQGGYLEYPKRGMVQITEKGMRALSEGSLTFDQLRNDPDFLRYHELKNKQKKTDDNSLDSSTPEDLIDSGIGAFEAQIKAELLEKLKSVNPYFFEDIICKLLKSMGYGDIINTKKSHDGGVDGIINQDKLGLEKIYLQAKRYSDTKVREIDIRNFIGAMNGNTTKGVFVTTSTFDDSAIKKALRASPLVISLIDGHKLVQLMVEHNIGVQVRKTYEIKEIDHGFFEDN